MSKPPPVPTNLRPLDHMFLDDLIAQLEGYERDLNHKLPPQYPMFRRLLDLEGVGRILFDARQAQQFADLVIGPTERIARQLKTPFPAFYMEFSEPVALVGEQWQVESGEYLRAFLVGGSQKLRVWVPPAPGELSGHYRTVAQPLHVVAFITDQGTKTFTDRMWRFDLETGETYVQRQVCEDLAKLRYNHVDSTPNGEEARVMDPDVDISTGLEPIEPLAYFPAGFDPETRVVGWWERATLAGSGLLQWCLAYMMAKSIVMETRHPHMSRQVRRQMQRKGIPFPKPWHVLTVDPRYRHTRSSDAEPGPGTSHGYRYDVIGTIRVNRHRVGPRKEDGTYDYRETIEWVDAHQRGLRHELYIPATRAVRAGRRVPRELRGQQD